MRTFFDEAKIAFGGVKDFANRLVSPSLRIGVTGLSRSGKTIFTTALVHNLLHGGRLPLLAAYAGGRIARVYLEPQPNDELPRFAFEKHIASLTAEQRHWPESTQHLSQLRVTIEFLGRGVFAQTRVPRKLSLDIFDYPGEWLLDLPLMEQSFEEWSSETIKAGLREPRRKFVSVWQSHLATLAPDSPQDEQVAKRAADVFTNYLSQCRDEENFISTQSPGRFLMPGDLAGSPLLTFAPLDVPPGAHAPKGTLWQLMSRRYNAYVNYIVKPFFLNYFARLDRQIVLVDVLSALNSGVTAVEDLKHSLASIIACYRIGANSLPSLILGRRTDRILFAATKSDLLHHSSHNRLESILRAVIGESAEEAVVAGARIDVSPLAAIRATREATVKLRSEILPCIVGTPEVGQVVGNEVFDGNTEVAVFPGDLPAKPETAINGSLEGKVKFVRFRPPSLSNSPGELYGRSFPHLHLDRAMEFIFGDRLA